MRFVRSPVRQLYAVAVWKFQDVGRRSGVDVARALYNQLSRGRRLPCRRNVWGAQRGGLPWEQECRWRLNCQRERSWWGVSGQEAAIAAKTMAYDAEDSNKNTSAAVRSEGEQFSDARSRETFQSRSTLIGQLQTLIVVQGPQQAAFSATKSRFRTDSSPLGRVRTRRFLHVVSYVTDRL
jgi:hypothetical protein